MTSCGVFMLLDGHLTVPSLVERKWRSPAAPENSPVPFHPKSLTDVWKDWSAEDGWCCSEVDFLPLGPPYHIAASWYDMSVVCCPADPEKIGSASISSNASPMAPEPSWSRPKTMRSTSDEFFILVNLDSEIFASAATELPDTF